MRYKVLIVICAVFVICTSAFAQSAKAVRVLTVETGSDAKVWLDSIYRGTTDESGRLVIKPVSAGRHRIRILAFGFKEVDRPVTARQTSLRAPLKKTFDRAEIAYQNAEKSLSEDKYRSIDLYREALRLSPRYLQAHIGLVRAYADTNDPVAAFAAIKKARRFKPVFPEISAIEGRVHKSEGDIDKAIASFERAIREARGFQPEAHTGLALIMKSEAEGAGARGEIEEEKLYYEDAAKSFEKAIDQLSATEPVVYLLLGQVYEKMKAKEKAIAVYRRFLRDMPEHEERSAVESFIEQLQKEEEI
ncbi:MAG: tetratricopeptide repeat protein [Pyrinomonadaceae bacterium]|nr:tetratricopeptide repeat protein [Pyrinomonadaceae bacterium]